MLLNYVQGKKGNGISVSCFPFALFRSIGRNPIPVNAAVPGGISLLPAGVAGVSFYGIDNTIFAFLHNSYMIGHSVTVLVKKDNLPCRWFVPSLLPLPSFLEPACSVYTAGKFRDEAAGDIAALDGAPGYKAGAPFHPSGKAIPRPVALSACVAQL